MQVFSNRGDVLIDVLQHAIERQNELLLIVEQKVERQSPAGREQAVSELRNLITSLAASVTELENSLGRTTKLNNV